MMEMWVWGLWVDLRFLCWCRLVVAAKEQRLSCCQIR